MIYLLILKFVSEQYLKLYNFIYKSFESRKVPIWLKVIVQDRVLTYN